jgi:hypothetical protein
MDDLASATHAPMRRPGLVTFAAIMMFLVAGFQLVWALVEFANAAWITANYGLNGYGTFGGALWVWGIIDTILALVAIYIGYDLLRGGQFGQIAGLILASVSAIRWFFYLPAVPWVALVIIAIDVLVIYSLVAHADYFSSSPLG